MRGGKTSPLSSPCIMMTPPISRVVMPHDVPQMCCSDLSRAWNWMPNAFAKFWPRLCDVAACSARPSPISASIEYVASAPANFSLSLFRPAMTGIASSVSTKSL